MNKITLLFIVALLYCCMAMAQGYVVFIGSYNKSRNKEGIYAYGLDTISGALKKICGVRHVFHPSYITVSPSGRYVYACTETLMPGAGSVSSFEYDAKNSSLTFINCERSGGENPVYLAADKSGRWLVNGNYTEGSVSVYPLDSNGRIRPARQIISFTEGSVNIERQERAHIHATVFSPDGRFLFLPDLGADKIRCYAFDAIGAQPLQVAKLPFTRAVPGSGPRHLTFHPSGQYAYCIEEMSGTVTAYKYKDGKLDSLQRIDAHNKQVKKFSSADIHISPDGLFLYASNRGDENNIAIFSVNTDNGRLSSVGYQSSGGNHPRNFVIDPTGKFLLAANQFTGNVVVFERNIKTGLLTETGMKINIPGASCLQIKKYP